MPIRRRKQQKRDSNKKQKWSEYLAAYVSIVSNMIIERNECSPCILEVDHYS